MLNEVVQLSVKNFPNGIFRNMKIAAPKQRQRHGAEQNDERIAEAVELRGEDQKDQNDREHEDAAEICAFDAQLTRAAGVIDDVTFRQDLVRFVFEKLQSGIERAASERR